MGTLGVVVVGMLLEARFLVLGRSRSTRPLPPAPRTGRTGPSITRTSATRSGAVPAVLARQGHRHAEVTLASGTTLTAIAPTVTLPTILSTIRPQGIHRSV